MKIASRPSFGRLTRVSAALMVSVASLTVAASENNVAAAATAQCKPAADVFGVDPNGDLFVFGHNSPEEGGFDWGTQNYIGADWAVGRTVAGPDGALFSARGDNGALLRLRWNGTGWDTMPSGTQLQTLPGNWARYATAENRNKLTVDEKERVYEIDEAGQLKLHVLNAAKTAWTPETTEGKVLDTGWGQYDLVAAAGDGVLYARKPTGELYRYRYHADTDRWLQYAKWVDVGWDMFNRVFSAGADTLYGTADSDDGGELLWYRYNEDTETWVDPDGLGRQVGIGWYGLTDVVATTNSCILPSYPVPARPNVPAPSNERAQMFFNPGTQKLEIVYVSNDGILRRGYQSSPGTEILEWQALAGHQSFTGRATAALRQDGRMITLAQSRTDADFRSYTQNIAGSTNWAGLVNIKGAMASSPILVKGAGDLLTAFAIDSGGKLWFAIQSKVDGPLLPWRQATGDGTLGTDFTVVRAGDAFEIVDRTGGTVSARKFQNGALQPTRVASGLTTAAIPSTVVFADGKVQLTARGNDNKLYTQKETATGFTGWTDISHGLSFKGSPAALLNPHGIVEIAVRGSDDTVYRGGQTAPGATTWRTWETNFDTSVVDPAFATTTGNEQRVFYLDGGGNYYLLNATAYTSDAAAAMTGTPQVRTVSPAVTEGKTGK